MVVTVLAWGLLWAGTFLAQWLVPHSPWHGAVVRLPALAGAAVLLWTTLWWRRTGFFRRPTRAGWARSWPGLMFLGWLLVLVAWRVERNWLALVADHAATSFWEEAVFRGFVLTLLLRRGRTFAVVGSAILFAASHFMVLFQGHPATVGVWGLVWPFGMGIFFAGLRLRTGTIWIGVLLHWFGNTLNAVSPGPLTWSGAIRDNVSIELAMFLVLYVSWGLALAGGWRHWGRPVSCVACAVIVVMSLIGIVSGGPRIGWEGPDLDAGITLLPVTEGYYRYRLSFKAKQARVVRLTMRFNIMTAFEVKEIRALAGYKTWEGRAGPDGIVWEGGRAPRTVYSFWCSMPPKGKVRYRVDYIDRYGWPRHWSGKLVGPG